MSSVGNGHYTYISSNLKMSFGGKDRSKCWLEITKQTPRWTTFLDDLKLTLLYVNEHYEHFYSHPDVFRHFLRNIYLSKAGRDPLQAHWHKLWVTSRRRRLPPSSTYSNESSWPQTWSLAARCLFYIDLS